MLEGMREFALMDPWTGRSGPRERWLYGALINTGGGYGNICEDGVILAASSRDLALMCGTSRRRVEDLLNKLEERGLIRCIEKGRGKKASKYLLIPQTCKGGHIEAIPYRGDHIEGALTYNTTVFIYGPLWARLRDAAPQTDKVYDKNGRKIPKSDRYVFNSLGAFRALIMEKVVAWPGMDLRGIAAILDRDPRTIEKYLPSLIEGGFVVEENGTYAAPDDLADRLLDELQDSGCKGREDDLRDRYERDRAGYEERRREKRLEAMARECGAESEPEPDGVVEDLQRVEEESTEDPVVTDANDPEQFKALAAMLREGVEATRAQREPFQWPHDPKKAAFYKEVRAEDERRKAAGEMPWVKSLKEQRKSA